MEEEKKTAAPEKEEKAEKTAKKETAKKTEKSKKEKELQKKIDEVKDQLLRTLAEYDNYRKRTQKEKDGMYADGVLAGVRAFLPAMDNLERALAAEEDSAQTVGVRMILDQMKSALEKLGVTEFGEAGEPFDPNLHAAVMHVDDDALPDNSIAEVLQKGYIYKDGQVVRHATVKVAN